MASWHLSAPPVHIVASANLATLIVDVEARITVHNIDINRPLEGLASIDSLRDGTGRSILAINEILVLGLCELT